MKRVTIPIDTKEDLVHILESFMEDTRILVKNKNNEEVPMSLSYCPSSGNEDAYLLITPTKHIINEP